jgi:hypothetical protein
MGYCYRGNRLVCDCCSGADGTVRKRRCPSGWCSSPAVCSTCWTDTTKRAEFDAHHITNRCGDKHADFAAREQRRVDLIAAGIPVRCAARSEGKDRVHVLFATKAGSIGYYMADATYDAIPLLDIATPDDYRKIGHLEDAPTDFVWTQVA